MGAETCHHRFHQIGDQLVGCSTHAVAAGQGRVLHAEGGVDKQRVPMHLAGDVRKTVSLLSGKGIFQADRVAGGDP